MSDDSRQDGDDKKAATNPLSDGEESESQPDPVTGPDDRDGGFDDPFAELDRETDGDTDVDPEEIDDFFESVETTDLDEEALWEDLLTEEEASVELDAEAGADAIVPIAEYCKRCEFFSEPPTVACNRPGTEIEALVDVDRFRVRNCPVVTRRGRTKPTFPGEEPPGEH